MKEQRRLKRFKLKLPARIELVPQDPQGETKILRLKTDNICSGGAFFDTLSPLPEGTPVRVDFVLDFKRLRYPKDKRPLVSVRGHVLRSEPTGIAVRFLKDYTIFPHSSV